MNASKKRGKRIVVRVDFERCKGCKFCMDVCPNKMFSVSKSFNKAGYHYIAEDVDTRCSGCMKCTIICPESAIELYEE